MLLMATPLAPYKIPHGVGFSLEQIPAPDGASLGEFVGPTLLTQYEIQHLWRNIWRRVSRCEHRIGTQKISVLLKQRILGCLKFRVDDRPYVSHAFKSLLPAQKLRLGMNARSLK